MRHSLPYETMVWSMGLQKTTNQLTHWVKLNKDQIAKLRGAEIEALRTEYKKRTTELS